jgi:hypothetical protein
MLGYCQVCERYLPTDTTSLLLAHVEDDDRVFGGALWRTPGILKNGLARRRLILTARGLFTELSFYWGLTAQRYTAHSGVTVQVGTW